MVGLESFQGVLEGSRNVGSLFIQGDHAKFGHEVTLEHGGNRAKPYKPAGAPRDAVCGAVLHR